MEVPYMNVYTFVTSNPNNTSDSFPLITDALTKRSITYGEWKRDTRRWAAGLQTLGFKRGDVLALFSFNQIDYSITMFGPMLLGGTTTTANSAYTVDELAYQLTDSGASVLVAHPEMIKTALESATMAGISLSKVFVYGEQTVQGCRPYSSLFPDISMPESQLPQAVVLKGEEAAETTALICYSSGTTGKSKGVELSHVNLCVNALQVTAADGPIPPRENVELSVLPMYHGAPNIVLQKFDFENFLRAIQEYKISNLKLVPPQVLMLTKSDLTSKYDLSTVREITVGAAPCSRELVEALVAKYPKASFRQAYGMSELSPASHIGEFHKMVHGSAGKVLPNQEVRLVDAKTGLDAAPGQPGEIWVRGPNAMKGYRNNPEATRSTIDAQGWLHTGDIAVVDEEQNFFVVDRMKELIKYKGFQVPPAELEAVLQTHPLVLDAAVIGVWNEAQATEVPLAFVVKQGTVEGQGLTEQAVAEYVASKVSAHKRLRGGVRFIEAVPKSAAGKILRKDLRAVVAKEQQIKAKL
ncbi:putative fatty-acid--CoA ligase FadD10 [Podila clonocystis]|nr:putative fatty-acid--CoA ligase FadD10 [Podila clonocystis]